MKARTIDRIHVYFFLGCYVLLGLLEPLVVSQGLMRTLFLAYFYAVLTPLLLWYVVVAYRESR